MREGAPSRAWLTPPAATARAQLLLCFKLSYGLPSNEVRELCYVRYMEPVPDEPGYIYSDDEAPCFEAYRYAKWAEARQLRGMAKHYAGQHYYAVCDIDAIAHRVHLVPSPGKVWEQMVEEDSVDVDGALLGDQPYFYDNTRMGLCDDDSDDELQPDDSDDDS